MLSGITSSSNNNSTTTGSSGQSSSSVSDLEEARKNIRRALSVSVHGGAHLPPLVPPPCTSPSQPCHVVVRSSSASYPPPPLSPRRSPPEAEQRTTGSGNKKTTIDVEDGVASAQIAAAAGVAGNARRGVGGSGGGGSSSVNASDSSFHSRSSLTETEFVFLESLLSDPNVPPDRVRQASDKLSDSSLFLPPPPPPLPPPTPPAASVPVEADADADVSSTPNDGNEREREVGTGGTTIGSGSGGKKKKKKGVVSARKQRRDSTVQRELFRAHERSGVAPSVVLRRLSNLGPKAAAAAAAQAGGDEQAGGGGGRDVVFLASRMSQGFEVMGRSAAQVMGEDDDDEEARGEEKGDVSGGGPAAGDGTDDPNETERGRGGGTAKKSKAKPQRQRQRQMEFQMAEGDKSHLNLEDNGDENDGDEEADDARTDREVRPTSSDEVAEAHVEDDIQSWELDSKDASNVGEDGHDGGGGDNDDGGGSGVIRKAHEVFHHQPDAWDVLRDEYAVGYGYPNGGPQEDLDVNIDDPAHPSFRNATTSTSSLPFKILGTHADDVACHPHVLSPPLMESIQSFMPDALTSGHNFWLKFSLQRDGPSLYRLLQHVRGSVRTVLAVETTDGHVFGSFMSVPWRTHWGYYGSEESFVWRMRRSRLTPCHSVVEQAVLESELEVYPFTGANESVQLCRMDKVGVGGGEIDQPLSEDAGRITPQDGSGGGGGGEHFGSAISLTSDLLSGTTSTCETFGSPCLTNLTARGEEFDVANLEVWTMTPCDAVKEAERDEMTRLFFEEEETSSKKLNIFGILMGAP